MNVDYIKVRKGSEFYNKKCRYLVVDYDDINIYCIDINKPYGVLSICAKIHKFTYEYVNNNFNFQK